MLSFRMHCVADQAFSQGWVGLNKCVVFDLEKVFAFMEGRLVRFRKGKGVSISALDLAVMD